MERAVLSLAELNHKVQQGIKAALPEAYWIRAEIAALKENNSGHCYLELIEKGENDHLIAKAKGVIWAFTYRMIKPYFFSATKRELSEGLKVLILVTIEFHELYGFSLSIKDIDPSYTLGDIALKKVQIIRQLKEEGVFDMNRELRLPLVPQRIAVISSKTAAGFEDFITHLEGNAHGYQVKWTLFPAAMQGEDTEKSIVKALDQIFHSAGEYDAVVIIRGGGAQSDLGCFDSYWLAYNITQIPLPVLTGIGHEQDDSIIDLVAHTRLKTPTAVADFILSCFSDFESSLDQQQQTLTDKVQFILESQRTIINEMSAQVPLMVKEKIFEHKQELQEKSSSLKFLVQGSIHVANLKLKQFPSAIRNAVHTLSIRNENQCNVRKQSLRLFCYKTFASIDKKVSISENTIYHSDPVNILKKGYSLTLHENKVLKDSSQVKTGDEIETRLLTGTIKSKII